MRNGGGGWGTVEALAAGTLVWLAAIDLESRLLPNRIVVPGTVVLLVACAVFESSSLVEHLLAAVVAGGFFFAAAMLRPADLGMGDVKLVLFLGVLLGTDVLNGLAIGFGRSCPLRARSRRPPRSFCPQAASSARPVPRGRCSTGADDHASVSGAYTDAKLTASGP